MDEREIGFVTSWNDKDDTCRVSVVIADNETAHTIELNLNQQQVENLRGQLNTALEYKFKST